MRHNATVLRPISPPRTILVSFRRDANCAASMQQRSRSVVSNSPLTRLRSCGVSARPRSRRKRDDSRPLKELNRRPDKEKGGGATCAYYAVISVSRTLRSRARGIPRRGDMRKKSRVPLTFPRCRGIPFVAKGTLRIPGGPLGQSSFFIQLFSVFYANSLRANTLEPMTSLQRFHKHTAVMFRFVTADTLEV